MIQKIRDFYLSRSLLLIATISAAVLWMADGIMLIVMNQNTSFPWIYISLIVIQFLAFRKGETNVQKTIFGALLMFLITDAIALVKVNGPDLSVYILMVTTIGQFIAHLFQQMDHTGKTPSVLVNQLIGISYIMFLVTFIFNLTVFEPQIQCLEMQTYCLAYAMTSVMLICMETRVGFYKKLRAASRSDGTWDDQKRQEAKNKYFRLVSSR